MNAKRLVKVATICLAVTLATAIAVAQAPAGGQGGPGGGRGAGGPGGPGGGGGGGGRAGGGGRGGPALTVTTAGWPDGDVIPSKYVNAGDKKSPSFDFKWMQGAADAMPPMTLQSYAIIFHDIENAPRGGEDTLHWMAWDIPGTTKTLPEGLPMGDLPDGTKQGQRGIGRGAYFGPGAGPGPYHHYVFEFYALDIKLNLPNTATRAEVMAAMEGHFVGKAAYVGRYHQ